MARFDTEKAWAEARDAEKTRLGLDKPAPSTPSTRSFDYLLASASPAAKAGTLTTQPNNAFIQRQQRATMLANNQWKPAEPVNPTDSAWAKMSPEEREGLELLPSHTFTMTQAESDRIRREEGGAWLGDLSPTAPAPGMEPAFDRSKINPEPLLERITDPVYSNALSWEAYDALSKGERAIVDFNSDFLDARDKDLKNQEAYKKSVTPVQRERYTETTADLFGMQGGSEVYAPNVVSLLDSVNANATGQDLDEWLNLDRVLTADDLQGVNLKDVGAPRNYDQFIGETTEIEPTKYAEIRTPENLQAIDVTITEKYAAKMDKVMQDGYLRLSDAVTSLQSARSTDTLALGGVGFNAPPELGFPAAITPGSDEALVTFDQLTPEQQLGMFFRGSYEVALDKQYKDPGQLDLWIKENKLTKDEETDLWEYVRKRIGQDRQYGTPDVLEDSIKDIRTPSEVEKFLGMEP